MAQETMATDQMSRKASLPFFILRAVGAFILLLALLLILFVWGHHGYLPVAEWQVAGDRDALIYEDTVYYLAGERGDSGLSDSDYAIGKMLGQVKPAEGWSFRALIKDTTPDVLYSVKNAKDSLVLVAEDGRYYVYALEIDKG